eukprot:jgi/Chlat1/4370/Chrsp29S04520
MRRAATHGPSQRSSPSQKGSLLLAKLTVTSSNDRPEQKANGEWLISFVAGAIAGASGVFVAHPLDTVKTRVQAGWGSQERGALSVARGIFLEDGMIGFYAGVGSAIASTAPAVAVRMATYESIQGPIRAMLPKHRAAANMLAAGIGEVLCVIVRNPFELVKQRLQSGRTRASVVQTVVGIIRAEGVRGLYQGIQASMLRDVPQTVLNFAVYRAIKDSNFFQNNTSTSSTRRDTVRQLAAGAIAGAVSAFLTTPMDVIKTKMMTAATAERLSVSLAARRIIAEEGAAGLMRGASTRSLLIVPDIATMWLVYELLHHALQRRTKARTQVVVKCSLI